MKLCVWSKVFKSSGWPPFETVLQIYSVFQPPLPPLREFTATLIFGSVSFSRISLADLFSLPPTPFSRYASFWRLPYSDLFHLRESVLQIYSVFPHPFSRYAIFRRLPFSDLFHLRESGSYHLKRMEKFVIIPMARVVDLLCGVPKKEISHMLNCSENVEKFKAEVEKLSSMKGRVQQQIDLANSRGEDLLDGVEEWMEKAGANICEAIEFINEEQAKKTCFNTRLCVNLGTLHHYGKMATKKTLFLQQHQNDGRVFITCVSRLAPIPRFVDLYQIKNLENINTQKSSLKMIVEAIKDHQIVGIVGLGGVGKTTLAKEAAAEMNNQFDLIEFITISQTIYPKKIKDEVEVAAKKIIKGEKVLIILDDVWEELMLEEMGIPCGSKYTNCKILLTSRSEYVCEVMDAKIIKLDPLTQEEAWTLFERVVGMSEWDDRRKPVALNIVKECGGLPLFVQVVGKALKNKEIKTWEAALHRLQDPTDENDKYKRMGILQLKLSFDYLESEVAKSCFLLCSMFPEDGTIGFNTLTCYGLGLGIFNDPDTSIHIAKVRVHYALASLKSSFLLFSKKQGGGGGGGGGEEEEEEEELFKMHAIVRDMAILITSKAEDKFWVQSGTGLREWQPRKHIESYRKISLMGNKIFKLPDHELLFPHLDTFLIQDNELSVVPDEFFRGMKKLKVLDMSRNDLSSLPQSLKHLQILSMLDLSENESLCEISILGELTCLEILKLRSTGITSIPREIGKLTKLRLLDVYSCEDLSHVAPGIISKLILLEELYVKKEGNCDFLKELSELEWLKILHLRVPELHSIPNIENLIDFDIGKSVEWETSNRCCKRCLRISISSFPFDMTVMKLVHVSEMLKLWDIKGLKNILPDLYQEVSDKLKYIELGRCGTVTSLVEQTSYEVGERRFFSQVKEIKLESLDSLEVLWDSPHQYISFDNLAKIYIKNCPRLLELFPLSVAQGLVNLRELTIMNCNSLKVVISAGGEIEETGGSKTEFVEQDTNIVIPLTHIRFSVLPKLESFYSGRSTIKYPSLKYMTVIGCPEFADEKNGKLTISKKSSWDDRKDEIIEE